MEEAAEVNFQRRKYVARGITLRANVLNVLKWLQYTDVHVVVVSLAVSSLPNGLQGLHS